MSEVTQAAPRRHLLTVALEDYFQVGAFNRWIQRGQWYRFETRLETNAQRVLDLLDRYKIQATFFVLGWIADEYPELVRRVAERGHELASKGYYHRNVRQMTPGEFREDLARARAALERASGRRVLGYRLADGWCGADDLWILDLLLQEGYAYDSSIAPMLRQWSREPWRRFVHQHKSLWEFPLSSAQLGGWCLPIAGGNYFRQFPHWLMRRLVRRWMDRVEHPFVMYFHAWELDPEQPRISTASLSTRIRHYRNLDQMQARLEDYFRAYRFTSVADYLGLDTSLGDAPPAAPIAPPRSGIRTAYVAPAEGTSRPLTLVVPVYNEELILPYLANTLRSVRRRLGGDNVSIVLVDDGSQDGTPQALHRLFDSWPGCQVLHHAVNQGVAAAILTGIRNAPTDLVASIDCDCTYDPHEVARMLPLMTEDVDVVTASPYHPEGQVRNVPGWRLLLSKTSSFLYRRVLRQKLFTYTSCFRLYRKSAVMPIEVREGGFLGVAELLGKLDLAGSRIVEMPAVLEVRMLGRSKMKTLRTIFGHLRLMARLAWQRLRQGSRPLHSPDSAPLQESHA